MWFSDVHYAARVAERCNRLQELRVKAGFLKKREEFRQFQDGPSSRESYPSSHLHENRHTHMKNQASGTPSLFLMSRRVRERRRTGVDEDMSR